MITIVDYGLGNLASIENMLKKVGYKSVITSDVEVLKQASKLILPGVGAFNNGMENIHQLNLKEVLDQKVLVEKTPILGICLGMQLMTKGSEEGKVPGLGWIDADTVLFRFNDRSLKIPHMGWNIVIPSNQIPLFESDREELKFYHVHSYYVKLKNEELQIAQTNYGSNFTTGFQRENILGVQFHPEKSHKFGMDLLRQFCEQY